MAIEKRKWVCGGIVDQNHGEKASKLGPCLDRPSPQLNMYPTHHPFPIDHVLNMSLERLDGGSLDRSSNPQMMLDQERYTGASAKNTVLHQMGQQNTLFQLKILAATGTNFWCLSSRQTWKENLDTKDWRQGGSIVRRLQRRR